MYIYIMFAFRKKCWLYPIGPQSPTVSCCREASVLVVPDAAPTFTYRSNGGGSSHRSYLFYKPGEKCAEASGVIKHGWEIPERNANSDGQVLYTMGKWAYPRKIHGV